VWPPKVSSSPNLELQALEKARREKEAHGEIETAHPGYLGAQDTYYVGFIKGVGKIYQQTFVDTYSQVVFAKVYMQKVPITAADILNDRVVPFFEKHEVSLLRVLTDRGTEYCGREDSHDYQLFLALNDIEHTKTKANHPQTNGICERVNRTMQDEFYKVAFRKKLYRSLEELQVDLDAWLVRYNTERTNQGKNCKGRTPMQTFLEDRYLATEKDLSKLTVPLAA
jgi:transposase InsO family protein